MAGSYPDPPGRRIEYDRDGSGCVFFNGVSLVSLTGPQMVLLNNENDDISVVNLVAVTHFVAVVFPTPMTIAGLYKADGARGSIFEVSTNTTTGLDGVWVAAGVSGQNVAPVIDAYRTTILTTGMPIANVTGVRIRSTASGSSQTRAFHIYGHRTAAVGNWLTLWHPTLNQALSTTPAAYDLGDDARGSGPDLLSFRVKNCSAGLTAQTITVSREALTDGAPTTVSLLQLRYNGGAYGNTAAVGNLAPGAISDIVDAKLDVTVLAPVGVWAPRVIAAAAAWV